MRGFRFGENVYLSTKEVKFPIVVKVEDGDYIKREVVANIVDKEEELFLCGRKTLQEWKAAVFFEENRLEFTEKKKRVNLELSIGGHMLIKLEKVGEWNDEESVQYVKKESDVNSRKAISKIHRILNHKKIEQMEYAYRNAGSWILKQGK